MSVKIRLNNRHFMAQPILIGSRLFEADETMQQPTVDQNLQNANQNQQNQNQQQNAQQTAQAQQPQQHGQQQNQNQQGQEQLGQTLDQLVNKIIYDAFSNMISQVSNQFQQLQLPEGVQVQWVKAEQPKDQTLQSVWAVVQQFLTGNVKAVATALQQKQNAQQSADQNQQNNNLNNNQPAQ